jgi:hypothetical protein
MTWLSQGKEMEDEIAKEHALRKIRQRGGDCVESVQGNCAQSVLVALKEEFPAIGSIPLNALTAVSSIALRGETCGAVVGALLVIGILSTNESSAFLEALPATLPLATRFCMHSSGSSAALSAETSTGRYSVRHTICLTQFSSRSSWKQVD